MVDGRRTRYGRDCRRGCTSRSAATAGKHDEADSWSHAKSRCASAGSNRSLPSSNRHSKCFLIERLRAVGIPNPEDREVTESLQGDESLFRRGLRRRQAHVPQRSVSTAVFCILQLDDQSIRVAQEEFVGISTFRYAYFHRAPAQPRIGRCGSCDSVLGEDVDDLIRVEIVDPHPKIADDAWRGCGRRESHVLWAASNAEYDGGPLPLLNRHSENALVEIDRFLHVGNSKREMVDGLDLDCLLGGLRKYARRSEER